MGKHVCTWRCPAANGASTIDRQLRGVDAATGGETTCDGWSATTGSRTALGSSFADAPLIRYSAVVVLPSALGPFSAKSVAYPGRSSSPGSLR